MRPEWPSLIALGASSITASPLSNHPSSALNSDAIAPNFVALRRQVPSTAATIRRRDGPAGKAAIRHDANLDFVHSAEVTIGNQTFSLTVDTGSADTWVASSDLECEDLNGRRLQKASCGFAKTFSGVFSQGMAKDRTLLTDYSSGEEVTGPMGFDKLTIGGLTVEKQELGLVTTARGWSGHSGNGILGLAGPDLAFVWNGQPVGDKFTNSGTRVLYDTVVTAMFKNTTMPSVFSLALDRTLGSSTGILAFGGVANVSVQGGFAKSPLVDWHYNETLVIKDFYMITPTAVKVGSTRDSATSLSAKKFSAIVDSASVLSSLPDDVLQQFDKALSKQSITVYSRGGMRYVRCTVTPPALGFQIGDKTFWLDPKDLVLTFVRDGSYCMLGLQLGSEPYVLGQNFLSNVLAVFDVGAREMRFAQRVSY